jgi:hypothetical protein
MTLSVPESMVAIDRRSIIRQVTEHSFLSAD